MRKLWRGKDGFNLRRVQRLRKRCNDNSPSGRRLRRIETELVIRGGGWVWLTNDAEMLVEVLKRKYDEAEITLDEAHRLYKACLFTEWKKAEVYLHAAFTKEPFEELSKTWAIGVM